MAECLKNAIRFGIGALRRLPLRRCLAADRRRAGTRVRGDQADDGSAVRPEHDLAGGNRDAANLSVDGDALDGGAVRAVDDAQRSRFADQQPVARQRHVVAPPPVDRGPPHASLEGAIKGIFHAGGHQVLKRQLVADLVRREHQVRTVRMPVRVAQEPLLGAVPRRQLVRMRTVVGNGVRAGHPPARERERAEGRGTEVVRIRDADPRPARPPVLLHSRVAVQ